MVLPLGQGWLAVPLTSQSCSHRKGTGREENLGLEGSIPDTLERVLSRSQDLRSLGPSLCWAPRQALGSRMKPTKIPALCLSPHPLGLSSHSRSGGQPSLTRTLPSLRLGLVLSDPSPDRPGLSEAISASVTATSPA